MQKNRQDCSILLVLNRFHDQQQSMSKPRGTENSLKHTKNAFHEGPELLMPASVPARLRKPILRASFPTMVFEEYQLIRPSFVSIEQNSNFLEQPGMVPKFWRHFSQKHLAIFADACTCIERSCQNKKSYWYYFEKKNAQKYHKPVAKDGLSLNKRSERQSILFHIKGTHSSATLSIDRKGGIFGDLQQERFTLQ